MWIRTAVAALGALCVLCACAVQPRTYATHQYYAIGLRRVDCGASPALVADALGAEFVERVGELDDHWLVRRAKSARAARDAPDPVLARLAQLKQRPARVRRCVGTACATERCIAEALASIEAQVPRMLAKRARAVDVRAPVPHVASGNRTEDFARRYNISDPLFYRQWYLVNNDGEHDLNMNSLWDEATGRGVNVALIDDGIEYTHPELRDSFFAAGSHDYNNHGDLPTPRNSDDRHGTRCAGEIVARRNDMCGVGVAPDAKVAGIRILSAPITEADEAAALNFRYDANHIYSCSWGPSDDGMSMDGPRGLVAKALLNGVNRGRDGKGSLFVFAGGNGGTSDDQCNFDGYTNSIYTMTIAAVDSQGRHPPYSEQCTAIIASSWSSGSGNSIYTTDVTKYSSSGCSTTHGGTSAAAPLVAALLALALEKRPELTWRDVQHIVIDSCHVVSADDPDWVRTQAGRMYNIKFGFGVVDASLFMERVKRHKLVPPQAWLDTPNTTLRSGTFRDARARRSSIRVTDTMLRSANLAALEHVTVDVWIAHPQRGAVQVELVSPHGTRSVLARPRRYDNAGTGFPGWTFSALTHWGEDPRGQWTLSVSSHAGNESVVGEFAAWRLHLWGAARDPAAARPWTFPEGSLEYNLTVAEEAAASRPPTYTPAKPAPATQTGAAATSAATSAASAAAAAASAAPAEPEPDTGALRTLWDATPVWLLVAAGVAVGAAVLAYVFMRRRRTHAYMHVPDQEGAHSLQTMQARDLYNAFDLEETHVLGESDEDEYGRP